MLKLQSKGWALFRNWQSDLQQSKKMTKGQIRFINPLFHVDWYSIITQKMLTFAFKSIDTVKNLISKHPKLSIGVAYW